VGPERIKDKCSYPGPQEEAKDDSDHGVRQMSVGYEETLGRNHNYIDTEKGVP
jgi:hypothetical protein